MRRRDSDGGPARRPVQKNKRKTGTAAAAPILGPDAPGMQQIAVWLKQLGMHQYIQHFAHNDIDFAILCDLTDQDLEKIGVTSLGHRRKLLRAIADLQEGESTTFVATAATAPRVGDSAERRQVTVLFSDLVGSTALSARMDPEDLREVISAYQKCTAESVRRFGGFVAKYMGDGVLVYFGYPEAHEDDAERAVRAGLDLIAAVSALKTPASLQTRVGIATGLVVVGDLVGSGEAQERGIVGETPNLAARLQGGSPSQTQSSLLRTQENFSVLCLTWRTSGGRTSKALPDRCVHGQPCGPVPWRAASTRCTQPV